MYDFFLVASTAKYFIPTLKYFIPMPKYFIPMPKRTVLANISSDGLSVASKT